MSHVASVELVINDIASLGAAASRLGCTFKRGQKEHRWYGRFLADSEIGRQTAEEFNAKTFGTCEHAIEVPGSDYDIGVVKNPTGAGYRLIYDQYGPSGHAIAEKLGGQSLPELKSEYGAVRATRYLQRQGYRVVRRVLANGQIKLSGIR